MRLALFLFLSLGAAAAERLKLEYFHDEEDSTLVLRAIAFSDAQRGMAVGSLEPSNGRAKGAGLVTSDGGRTWTPIALPGQAAWLFLDARAGWIGNGLQAWKTEDFGKTWKRVRALDRMLHVFFLDERRGWAAGPRRTVLETTDGGERWTRLAAAVETKTSEENTFFSWIEFAGDRYGVITGSARPPRRSRSMLPDWQDPENRPREWPSTTVLLQTLDSGKTWTPSQVSLFGQITRVRMTPGGYGLALVEFRDDFPYPAEVYRMDFRSGGSPRVFRKENRAVTDMAVREGGAFLVAVEPPGTLLRTPVPGKLKLLHSKDLAQWDEIPADYRAVAARAVCAWAGGTLWVATDTGMLLALRAE
jgi:hypothetical protein